jgi:hypothetical protein
MTDEPGTPPPPPPPDPPLAQPPAAVPPGYAQPVAPAGGAGPVVGELAIKRGVGRVIGFTLLSPVIYPYYWFFVTRKQLNSELGSTDDAGLYTAGLLVPILNIIIIYWLWRDIDALRRRVGMPEFNVILWLVLSAFVPFAAIVFYPMVVNRLNEYWDVRTHGLATDADLSAFEKAAVVIGACLLALWLLTLVVGIVAAVLSAT